jgi:hypothetical protein
MSPKLKVDVTPFLLVYVLVCALPIFGWTARNTSVAGFPVALGTRGVIDLPACYTRVCLDNGGRWRPLSEQPYRGEMEATLAAGGEWAAYQKGKELFWRELKENWRLLPRLVAAKIKLMLVPVPPENPHDIGDTVIIALAAAGVVLARRERWLWAALAPILGSVAMAAALHAMQRFRVPMLPGLVILAGYALSVALVRIRTRAARKAHPE